MILSPPFYPLLFCVHNLVVPVSALVLCCFLILDECCYFWVLYGTYDFVSCSDAGLNGSIHEALRN